MKTKTREIQRGKDQTKTVSNLRQDNDIDKDIDKDQQVIGKGQEK